MREHQGNECVIDLQTEKGNQVELQAVFFFLANINKARQGAENEEGKGRNQLPSSSDRMTESRHRPFCLLTGQLATHLRLLLSHSPREVE